MAAPAETIVHGTASTLVGLSNEPAVTPTVKVTKISHKFDCESTETRNTNGTVTHWVDHSFKLDIGFEGQIALNSGLGDQAPGSAVSSLASFAAANRTFDPAFGLMAIYDIEDSTENMNSAPMTKFTIRHMPNAA
jgi:hypothetical protein